MRVLCTSERETFLRYTNGIDFTSQGFLKGVTKTDLWGSYLPNNSEEAYTVPYG